MRSDTETGEKQILRYSLRMTRVRFSGLPHSLSGKDEGGGYRTSEIATVPATTHNAPIIVRKVKRSMPRRKSQVPRRIHSGLVATIGETITTGPKLSAAITK